ncbi:MAG: hypothetical protein JRK53_09030 [Deltaproteobacteria bacterium]|nr:hypothetical protein [Deltaproteobacteria bacterium]
MKCPKCGYISFDHHASCPKCKKNISSTQGQLNLPDFEIKTPALLVEMATQAGAGAGIRIQEAHEAVVAVTLDTEEAAAVDLERDAVPGQKMGGLSIDFDDLTLIPDDDDYPIETVDLDQLTTVESEIDLAIDNLEPDDLLSVDALEDVSETRRPPGKKPAADSIGGKPEDSDLALDLEDLELDLDLDGERKK